MGVAREKAQVAYRSDPRIIFGLLKPFIADDTRVAEYTYLLLK